MSWDTDKRIQGAIEIGQKNLRTMQLVRNWCAHVSVQKTGGTGLVEAQTGLPIGHHALSCPHAPAGGLSTWDLQDAAVDFHDRNCHDCKVRKPVGLPNISELVAERQAERVQADARQREADSKEAAVLAARDAVRGKMRLDLDPGGASVIDLLTDVDHGRGEHCVERFVEMAKLSPESFTPEIIDHLFAMVEARVHRLIEPVLSALSALNVDPTRLCNAALIALGNHAAIGVAGSIVAEFSDRSDARLVSAALPALITLARPSRDGFGGEPRQLDARPLRAVYNVHPAQVLAALDDLIAQPRTYSVATAARGVSELSDTDKKIELKFARALAAKLVRKKHLLPDLSN